MRRRAVTDQACVVSGPDSCVNPLVPVREPGVVWQSEVSAGYEADPLESCVSVSGEVNGCAVSVHEHVNPSSSRASLDASHLLCEVDKVLALQDLNCANANMDLFVCCDDDSQHKDLYNQNLPRASPLELETEVSDGNDSGSRPAVVSITSPLGQNIKVYPECTQGNCECVYSIGNIECQLKPCRFASLIYKDFVGRESEFEFLLWAITDGFPIVDSDVESYECENYSSITCEENSKKMNSIIAKELAEGMISISDVKPHCIHSLGAVPKTNGGIRPITDCNRPLGRSINNHCESLLNEFCFKNVDSVLETLSENEFMTVVDIKSAYRAVPIRESHRKFQGFCWIVDGERKWFVDNRLCFGSRLGPSYFNMLSNFVYEILTVKYGLRIVNYLDDFIAVSSNFSECARAQKCMIDTLRFLGFHVSFDKVVGPSKSVVYLGIVIDSERMELRLPEGKLVKLITMLDKYLLCKRISKKELESLGGLLSHCSHVVKGGKIFCRSVYDLYKSLVKSSG